MQRTIYLAAPFFTPGEQATCGLIEDLCVVNNKIFLFSPRLQSAGIQGKLQDPGVAGRIFLENVRGIRTCSEMLCVLDRQPKEGELHLVKSICDPDGKATDLYDSIVGPIHIPDTGTVWEMGFAHALQRTIVGYTSKERGKGNLNLMLTQCCDGVLHGEEELRSYLSFQEEKRMMHWLQENNLKWKGLHE